MKKILLIIIFIIPISVNAMSLECPKEASVNEEIVCLIKEENLIGINANISIGKEFNYSKIEINDNSQPYYYSKDGFSIRRKVDNSSLSAKLSFKVTNEAIAGNTYNITLKNIEGVTTNYQHQNIENLTQTIRIISNINTLDNLIISNGKINPNFNKDKLKYEITTTDSKINIDALLTDKSAKIEGDVGTKDLAIGSNVFTIKVTSERGETKTYQIIVTRTIPKSKSPSEPKVTVKGLKEITIDGKKINVEKNNFTYKVTVSEDTKKIDIKANSNDKDATISIDNIDELKEGENYITINLKEKDGTEVKYTVIVNKPKKKDQNTIIKSLEIKDGFIDFKPNKYEYTVNIYDEKSLDLQLELESKTAKYEIIGNKNLKNNSIIKIIVTSEDGNQNIYTIKVNKIKNIENSKNIQDNLKLPLIIISIILVSIILILKTILRRKHK